MKPRILLFSLSLLVFVAWPAQADDPIVGEIRLLASSSPPDGWLICDGSSLNTDEYYDLWSTIGYGYGGMLSEFNIPNLIGRVPVGLSSTQTAFDSLGETGGEISHTLTINEMPSHNHTPNLYTGASGSYWQVAGVYGNGSTFPAYNITSNTGGGQPHNNLQPYITLNYIIFTGVYQNPTPTPTPTSTPIPGGATGPLTGTITGSLVISQALPSYAFTQTLTTGNEFVYFRSASYGEIIAGFGALLLFLGVIFWFVTRSTRRNDNG